MSFCRGAIYGGLACLPFWAAMAVLLIEVAR